MSDFLSQGGYGFFVWGAYGMVALALIAEVLELRRRSRAILRHLARLNRLSQAKTDPAELDPGTPDAQDGQI